ncbi:MAG: hypothetical protein K0T99_02150 [Alphaproteobacteria bacterium]|nr:hypothetical protein [Alphaproteobacteria bacterium]
MPAKKTRIIKNILLLKNRIKSLEVEIEELNIETNGLSFKRYQIKILSIQLESEALHDSSEWISVQLQESNSNLEIMDREKNTKEELLKRKKDDLEKLKAQLEYLESNNKKLTLEALIEQTEENIRELEKELNHAENEEASSLQRLGWLNLQIINNQSKLKKLKSELESSSEETNDQDESVQEAAAAAAEAEDEGGIASTLTPTLEQYHEVVDDEDECELSGQNNESSC